LQSPSENSKVHWDSNSQNGSSLESVRVHSLTLFYTLKSMRCDFRASLLAHNLASPRLGCEPKIKVATWLVRSWNTFGARMNHEQTQTPTNHHSPNLGEAITFPFIVFSVPGHGANTQMSYCLEIWTPMTLDAHNFFYRTLIEMRSEIKL
jgi:hypothetical protein